MICKTARDLNLKSVDEARALSYEQGMQKAGIVLGGVKQAFAVYGLNMDKALDSVKVETVSANGDAAKVKISYSAFETPFSTESDLVRSTASGTARMRSRSGRSIRRNRRAHRPPRRTGAGEAK